jgi:hypothetical protein
LDSGDVLSFKVLARIGTDADGTRCGGPGAIHSNAQGLRLYYDSHDRNSRFDITITPRSSADLFLHSDGRTCPAGGGQSAGVTTRLLDDVEPTMITAKCQDSGNVKFAGGNPSKVIGTWNFTAP